MKTALFFAAIFAASLFGQSQLAAARVRHREVRMRPHYLQQMQTEANVPQIPENLRERAGAPPPEILPTPDKKQQSAQNTAPTTCTAANASSPSCYTATQQSRSVAK